MRKDLDPEQLDKLKQADKTKYILNPYLVSAKDEQRLKDWSRIKMEKYESKLGYHWADKAIIASGELEPEEIDVKNIYPFKDLHWVIYRHKMYFNLMLISKNRCLFVSSFAKV